MIKREFMIFNLANRTDAGNIKIQQDKVVLIELVK